MADDDIPDEDLLFDPNMKKKKKKKKVEETEAVEEKEAAPEVKDDDLTEMFGEKKKKKKKVVTEDVAAVEATPATSDDTDMSEFVLDQDLKKKKKKKMPYAAFLEALEMYAAEKLADEDDFMKKKGDDEGLSGEEDYSEEESEISDVEDDWVDSDRDYTYQELLTRAFNKIRAANPDYGGERKRYTMIPPQVMREGTKKTVFINLNEIGKRMHRPVDHVIQFLFAELGTSGSVDGGQRLVIKGRFQPKQIENVLRRYILEYVTCKICKSADTILTKENRLMFVHCESCGSHRSVAAIKTGFSAQIGRRKKK